MPVPIYAAPLTALRDADWVEFADCYEADDQTPRDFAGCEAEITLAQLGTVVERLRSQDGECEITWSVQSGPLNRIQARWPAAAVAAASVSGEYSAEFRVFHPDGAIEGVGILRRVVFE